MKALLYRDYDSYASFYDIFTKYRNINTEVKFILDIIKTRKRVLDVGCGSGKHVNILENLGYEVVGIDSSKRMVEVSKANTKSNIYNMNVLDLSFDEKFDAIICMKSVLNHLKNYEELEVAIKNMINYLEKDGIIIIDLDNKRINGTYNDKVDGNRRIIESNYNETKEIQKRKFTYHIGARKFEFLHEYIIYNPKEIEKILNKLNVKYIFLTNYSKQGFDIRQKRLQIIIRKMK